MRVLLVAGQVKSNTETSPIRKPARSGRVIHPLGSETEDHDGKSAEIAGGSD